MSERARLVNSWVVRQEVRQLARTAPADRRVAPGAGSASEPIEARFRLVDEPATALVPFERVTELTAGLVERIGELTMRSDE